MAGTLAFFDGNSDFRAEVVNALDDDATVIGWGDASNGEDAFIGVNSTAGVKALPADHARNLSVLSGIREDRSSQRGGGGGRAPEPDPNAHYVTFLITDGDNIQWMLGDFPTDKRWFGSPRRGEIDLGWGISPPSDRPRPVGHALVLRPVPQGPLGRGTVRWRLHVPEQVSGGRVGEAHRVPCPIDGTRRPLRRPDH